MDIIHAFGGKFIIARENDIVTRDGKTYTVKGGELIPDPFYKSELCRVKAQNEDLKADCRKFIEKQVVYTKQYLAEKERADKLHEKVNKLELSVKWGKERVKELREYALTLESKNELSKPTTCAEACKDLKPFDRVLVRSGHNQEWGCSQFSHIKKSQPMEGWYVTTSGMPAKHCLPLEQYKRLLGTTKDPFEKHD